MLRHLPVIRLSGSNTDLDWIDNICIVLSDEAFDLIVYSSPTLLTKYDHWKQFYITSENGTVYL